MSKIVECRDPLGMLILIESKNHRKDFFFVDWWVQGAQTGELDGVNRCQGTKCPSKNVLNEDA